MELKLILQLIGIALGLLYLWLEYKANIWLWAVGIVMPFVHGYLYYRSGLYADAAMNVYYILAGLYGWCVWLRGKTTEAKTKWPIGHLPMRVGWTLLCVYVLLHGIIYFLLIHYTNSTVPFWDSLTTSLSMIAMWMLSRKYVEQWLVWLVVDAITVGLYIYKDIPFTAGLYALYAILAVLGYLRWLKQVNMPLK